MAETVIATGNRAIQFDSDVFLEYVRKNQYAKYLGSTEDAAIQVIENLTKMPGDAVTVSLVGRMKGVNVGTGTLEGNEELIGNFDHKIIVKVIRNAFVINNFESKVSAFDIRMAGKTQLKNWAMDLFRDEINEALHSRNGVSYAASIAADHNDWQVDNSDRVMYIGTSLTGSHANDLASLTNGVDILTADQLSLARRKMRTADPKIKPTRVNGSEEWFIFFCDTYMFRDLIKDPVIQAARRDAMERGKENPLFTAGDVIWDGIIIHEVPEISDLIDGFGGPWGPGASSGVYNLRIAGNSGSGRVGVGFMLGAQAVGVAYGKRMVTTTDTRDYGFVKGFGVEEFRETEKLLFQTGSTNKVDHGVLTMYAAASLD